MARRCRLGAFMLWLLRITFAFILLFTAACAHTMTPALAERGFYKSVSRDIRGAANPWPDIEELRVEGDDALALKAWLLTYRGVLASYPPNYESDAHITDVINAWQRMRPAVERLAASEPSLNVGALVATFWFYGHHIDEPDAPDRAYAIVGDLAGRFPDAALPSLLHGLLLTDSGGDGAATALVRAKKSAKKPRFAAYADMGLTTRCIMSGKRHEAAVALASALQICAQCLAPYGELLSAQAYSYEADASQADEEPYGVANIEGAYWLLSPTLGYAFAIPENWEPGKHTAYSPERGTVLYVNRAPLPDSGLIHGIIIMARAIQDDEEVAPDLVKKLLATMAQQAEIKAIEPLHNNPLLNAWHRVDTQSPVGVDDTISVIVAGGVIMPKAWSLAEHQKRAAPFAACDGDHWQKETPAAAEGGAEATTDEGSDMQFFRAPARYGAPVELIITYNGSKKTYAEAERAFKAFLDNFEIEEHAGSEVFEALVRLARGGQSASGAP